MKDLERYIADVDTLSLAVTTTVVIKKVLDFDFPFEHHEFHDEEALTSFLTRWKLHREVGGHELALASCECF